MVICWLHTWSEAKGSSFKWNWKSFKISKSPPPLPPPLPQLYAILKAPFEVAYAQDSFENLQLKGDGAWFVTISTQASS